MDKAMFLKYFIISILAFYLVKGILYIALWQGLIVLERRGKEKLAKRKKLSGKALETF